jgi:hypothetical protein
MYPRPVTGIALSAFVFQNKESKAKSRREPQKKQPIKAWKREVEDRYI